jgi:hypothetical protein
VREALDAHGVQEWRTCEVCHGDGVVERTDDEIEAEVEAYCEEVGERKACARHARENEDAEVD